MAIIIEPILNVYHYSGRMDNEDLDVTNGPIRHLESILGGICLGVIYGQITMHMGVFQIEKIR